jgi:hypothetical protein
MKRTGCRRLVMTINARNHKGESKVTAQDRIGFSMGSWRLGMSLGLVGTLLLAGCGPNEVVLMGTPDDAQQLLAEALQAWQSGQTPEDLQSASPAMHVADEDWEAGRTLKAFEPTAEPEERGGHWRVSAVLTLSDAGQAEEQKPVAYAITTEPAITIIRVDDVQ